MAETNGAKLRIGVMLDAPRIMLWESNLLQRVQASSGASIELLILNAAPPPDESPFWRKLVTRWHIAPAALVRRAVEFAHHQLVDGKTTLPDPFVPGDLPESLQAVPRMTVVPIQKRVSDYFRPADIETIRAAELDVIIRLGFRIVRGEILRVPQCGVWSLHHGDNRVNRGGPAGFWESMEAWPTTGVTLQILTEDLDNGTVIDRTTVTTNPWSVQENRAHLFWKSVQLIPRKLEQLHRLGKSAFLERASEWNRDPPLYCRHLFTQPTTARYARLVAKKMAAKTRQKWRDTFSKPQWGLLYDLRDGISSSFWRYRPLPSPSDRYWADPHVIARDGKYYIFVEEYLYARQRGRIAVLALDEKGNVSAPTTVLEKPHHVSYPFVWEWEGQVYMVPETGAVDTVELYRCIRFPDQWEHVMNLMEGIHLVDATLHHDGQRWWMFAGLAEPPRGTISDQTVLYYADDFRSTEWTPHPGNPIATDVTRSRPAGALFTYQGRLYRPTQNCSPHYGYGFQLCHVQELTTDRFEESPVNSVTPDWHPHVQSTHTFNHTGRLTIIDAEFTRPITR